MIGKPYAAVFEPAKEVYNLAVQRKPEEAVDALAKLPAMIAAAVAVRVYARLRDEHSESPIVAGDFWAGVRDRAAGTTPGKILNVDEMFREREAIKDVLRGTIESSPALVDIERIVYTGQP